MKPRILFVCLGNICRSPAAEGVMWRQLEQMGQKVSEQPCGDDCWVVDSAGTGNYHIGDLPDSRMRYAASRRGYSLTHRCRQVREADFDRFDYIVGMDSNNVSNLRRLAPTPEAEKKVVGIGRWLDHTGGFDYVPDPYYEGQAGFELVLDQLEHACQKMIDELS